MKKKIILLFTAVIFFAACTKKTEDLRPPVNPPTVKVAPALVTNPTFHDMTMVGVKTDTVVASFWLNPNDAAGMTTAGPSSISFIYSGAFKPSTGYKNIYFVATGPNGFYFKSDPVQNVADAGNYFNQWSRSFAPNTGYLIEIHADVTVFATDGIGADDKCAIVFKLVYQSDGSNQNKILIDTGQTITFSKVASSTLETSLDPMTPANQTIIGNQEVELVRMKIKSIGGPSFIENQTVQLGDLNALTAVSTVKVYDSAAGVSTLIGTGTISGQSSVVNLNLTIAENAEKTFLVKVSIGSIVGNVSGSNLSATSDKINYKDAGGTSKVNDIDRVGNIFSLIKAKQVFTSVALSGILQNNTLADGCKNKITSVGGNTATKQLTYEVTLVDNGTHVDTLSYVNLYLKVNGVLQTNVRFTNSAGQIIDSIGPGDKIVHVTYVSGPAESINPVGVGTEYVLGGRFKGFIHLSSDGDLASIKLIAVDAPLPSGAYRYANSGVAPDNLNAKIWTSPNANAGAVVQNNVWSDMSDPNHNFGFGVATGDGKGGYVGVVDLTVAQIWQ